MHLSHSQQFATDFRDFEQYNFFKVFVHCMSYTQEALSPYYTSLKQSDLILLFQTDKISLSKIF